MSIKKKMLLGQINHFTVFLKCEKFYFSQINMIMNNGSFGKITLPRIGSSLNVFFFFWIGQNTNYIVPIAYNINDMSFLL